MTRNGLNPRSDFLPATPSPTTATPRLLFTKVEVGDALHLSTRTVENLLATGELPGVKIGRSIRVRPADLEAFIARKAAATAAEKPATSASNLAGGVA
jgi:excisionase family DNA binding protein